MRWVEQILLHSNAEAENTILVFWVMGNFGKGHRSWNFIVLVYHFKFSIILLILFLIFVVVLLPLVVLLYNNSIFKIK